MPGAKLAVDLKCFGEMQFQDACEALHELGFSSVELALHPDSSQSNQISPWSSLAADDFDGSLARISAIQAAGLGVSSVAVESTEGLGELSEAVVQNIFRLTQETGASVLIGRADSGQSDSENSQTTQRLRELAELASAHQVTICLENVPWMCGHANGMLRAIHEIDHPAMRLSFDTANLPYYNEGANVEISLAKVCHLVQHMRLRDSSGEFGRSWFPALGYGGAVDFVRVWQLMSVSGFAGSYTILVSHGSEGPLQNSDEWREAMGASLRTLSDCGFLDDVGGEPGA